MFLLDLGELNNQIDAKGTFLESFDEILENCHNAVMQLTENGFIGQSQFACMEQFNTWINECRDLYTRMIYVYSVLQIALSGGNEIKKSYHELPFPLGSNSSVAGENTGYISLKDSAKLLNSAKAIQDNEVNDLLTKIKRALWQEDTLYFTNGSGDIEGTLNAFQTACTDEENKLTDFRSKFKEYVTAVEEFERSVSENLNTTTDEDFSITDAFDKLGLTLNIMDHSTRIVEQGATAGAAIIQITNSVSGKAVIDGKYLRLSGYKQGEGLAARYLIENLDKYPKAKALYNSGRWAKAAKAANTVGKVVTVATVVVGVGGAIYNGTIEYDRNPYLPQDKRESDAIAETSIGVVETGISVGGVWAGATLGAKGGAALGTLICPGLGTAIGAAVGAIFGGLFGGWATDKINEDVIDSKAEQNFKDWRYNNTLQYAE